MDPHVGGVVIARESRSQVSSRAPESRQLLRRTRVCACVPEGTANAVSTALRLPRVC